MARAELEKRVARLTPAQRALLEKRMQVDAVLPADGSSRIPKRTGMEYPLSIEQEQVWLVDQLGTNAYYLNLSHSFQLMGQLDARALEAAINEIVRRHENLRTRFPNIDGKPIPAIEPHLTLPINRIDISYLPEGERTLEAQRLVTERICQPFDIINGPLIRITLLRLGDQDHALLITTHHLITDRVSYDIIANELAILYDAFSKRAPSPLPELPIQYGDFAVWQRQWLNSRAAQSQLDFWKKKLVNAPTLDLLTDRRRGTFKSSYRANRETWVIPSETWEKFKSLCLAESVTRFMGFLAIFNLVLYRYTSQSDILIGTPVSNRDRVEVQGLIGYFLNVIVFRTDLSGNPTFRELLARVREVCLEALAHQGLPYDFVLQDLHLKRGVERPSLFRASYAFTNESRGSAPDLGLKVESLDPFFHSTWVDLGFGITDVERTALVLLDYDTDLFDPAAARRMMGHFRNLLEGVIADHQQRLLGLPLLGEEERRQLVEEWNATEADYPKEKCVHELFEEQVERGPEAVALSYEDEQLSYGELNASANRLAHYLRELGVGREARVAICMERSVQMVVALLGVLKAGGAYVPLDPVYPPERLSYMLEDSAPVVLLTHDAAGAVLAEHSHAAPILNLDRDAAQWAGQSGRNPDRAGIDSGGRSLAYIIYTSGSTGLPKGAMNEHWGAVNRLVWMQQAYGLGAQEAVLQKTPFSFDVSVWEFFWPLLFGARLVMARSEGHKDPAYLARIIREQKITTMHFVPLMLHAFLEHDEAPECRDLVRVICSGEALPVSLAQRFYERLPGTELHNLYGPTETAVDVTAWNCWQGATGSGIPIGRPIANTRIYILDGYGQPAPIGVAGELNIAGVQVGRGYLNRPELTAESFLPDPFSPEPGARIYKTGDLGRWLPEGEIGFLGRNDFQVKVRGFRIELGEIEAALREHSGVKEAVVVARLEDEYKQRLVAYLVPEEGMSLSESEIRRTVKQKLPDYMTPSALVMLERLPLTANGKLDRRALPEPGRERPGLESEYLEPRTPLEELVAGIWSQVLGVERVGVNDNFFDLGGDSLLMAQVHSQIKNTLKIEFPLIRLFEYPTIHALATGMTNQGSVVIGEYLDARVKQRRQAFDKQARLRRKHYLRSQEYE